MYPIVPSFCDWQFPHGKLPPSWERAMTSPSDLTTRSNVTTAVYARDVSCRMSRSMDGCEKAHLVPLDEAPWFRENQMQRYNWDDSLSLERVVCDLNNMLLLRSDLHKSFDVAKFVFVPKLETGNTSKKQITSHILDRRSKQLAELYHNVAVQPIDLIPSEFLLARVAWALFPRIEGFLFARKERMLVTAEDGARLRSEHDCLEFRKSKYPNPKKPGQERQMQDPQPQKRGRSEETQDGEDYLGVETESSKRAKPFYTSDASIGLESSPSLAVALPSRSIPVKQIPIGPLTPLDSLSSALPRTAAASNTAADGMNLDGLKVQFLKKERERSDPSGQWEQKKEWAYRELMQPSATPGSMLEIYQILGVEVSEAEIAPWKQPHTTSSSF